MAKSPGLLRILPDAKELTWILIEQFDRWAWPAEIRIRAVFAHPVSTEGHKGQTRRSAQALAMCDRNLLDQSLRRRRENGGENQKTRGDRGRRYKIKGDVDTAGIRLR